MDFTSCSGFILKFKDILTSHVCSESSGGSTTMVPPNQSTQSSGGSSTQSTGVSSTQSTGGSITQSTGGSSTQSSLSGEVPGNILFDKQGA